MEAEPKTGVGVIIDHATGRLWVTAPRTKGGIEDHLRGCVSDLRLGKFGSARWVQVAFNDHPGAFESKVEVLCPLTELKQHRRETQRKYALLGSKGFSPEDAPRGSSGLTEHPALTFTTD